MPNFISGLPQSFYGQRLFRARRDNPRHPSFPRKNVTDAKVVPTGLHPPMSASSKRALDDILGLAVLFIARPLCVLLATGHQRLPQFRNRYSLAIRSFATLVD